MSIRRGTTSLYTPKSSFGCSFERCEWLTQSHLDEENRACWNNDGIDVTDCRHVRISDCQVNAADDGICLKSDCADLCKKMLLSCTLLLLSCEDVFQTHPYDVDFKGETRINVRQTAEIERRFADSDTLRVAFISDTHLWHSDARDEVADINRRENIDFVIHCGDLTDTGTTKEYEWSRDILGGLRYPFVALVGNHDFLGTGDQTYSMMYGAMDFSFIAARVKFVCLNTNATEYDYMAPVPNFDYMEEEFTKDSARFDRTVIVMHAPPYSDQFNNNVCKAFRRYLDFFPGLMSCVYGHNHSDKVDEIYGDGLLFYGIDCAEHRNYRIMTITPDGYEMEQIRY